MQNKSSYLISIFKKKYSLSYNFQVFGKFEKINCKNKYKICIILSKEISNIFCHEKNVIDRTKISEFAVFKR
jgi:hypothetical protein